jgi:hypothetical protein
MRAMEAERMANKQESLTLLDKGDKMIKIMAYVDGNYTFKAPPVCHAAWTTSMWIA